MPFECLNGLMIGNKYLVWLFIIGNRKFVLKFYCQGGKSFTGISGSVLKYIAGMYYKPC